MNQTSIHSQTEGPSASLRGNAICMMAVALFATGFPAAEALLNSWGAISLITVRCGLACLLLLPVWIAMDGWRRVAEAPWMRGLGIGALGFGTGTVVLLVIQDFTDPVTAALIAATMPVSAVALEVMLDGRRLTRNFLTGTGLVLLGGILATGANITEGKYGWSIAFGLGVSVLFAWGSRKTVKGLPGMSMIGQSTLTLIGTAMFCLAIYDVFVVVGLPGTHVAALDSRGWVMLFIYGWASLGVSQVFWIYSVSRLGVGIASFHLNAAPFYVMLIIVAMGGAWDWQRVLGAVILGFGVILAQQQRTRLPDVIWKFSSRRHY